MKLSSGASQSLIRILVADSNQTQSQLLSGALRRHSGFQVNSCGAETSACLASLQASPADVILLGDGPPGAGPGQCEVIRHIHHVHPRVAPILLIDSYDRDLVVNAFRSGVRGLFCRACQPFKSLCRCIHVVHSGQIWTNTEQLSYVIDALAQSPSLHVVNATGEALLTPREEQVVTLVVEGLTNRQISRELRITENTVKKCLLHIFDKLGISNRVELVLYALTQREPKAQNSTSLSSTPAPSRPPRQAILHDDDARYLPQKELLAM